MKTLVPLFACVVAASVLFFGFPELRVDRDATSCRGGPALRASGQAQ